MRNKSTLFYSVSQVKVVDEIYWQKGPVTLNYASPQRILLATDQWDSITVERCVS